MGEVAGFSLHELLDMMMTTGLRDSQMQYFEPAKWVAKLCNQRTDSNKLIMYTNMDAGNGYSSIFTAFILPMISTSITSPAASRVNSNSIPARVKNAVSDSG